MCWVGKTSLPFCETGLFGIRIMCLVGKTSLPFGETGLFGIRIMCLVRKTLHIILIPS
jgi:hypothetical protein